MYERAILFTRATRLPGVFCLVVRPRGEGEVAVWLRQNGNTPPSKPPPSDVCRGVSESGPPLSLPSSKAGCLYMLVPPPSRVTPHYAAGASLVGGRRRDHRRGNKEPSDRRSSNLSARHERFGSSRTNLSLSSFSSLMFSCIYIYFASGRWKRESRDITIVFEHQ